jgi:hypothetical protein
VWKGKLHHRLGSLTEHTVYEGELVGLMLGAGLLWKETNIKRVTFCTDNQAAIQSLDSFKPGPGHYIADGFLHMIAGIHHKFPGVKSECIGSWDTKTCKVMKQQMRQLRRLPWMDQVTTPPSPSNYIAGILYHLANRHSSKSSMQD